MDDKEKDRHKDRPYPLRLPIDLRTYLETTANKSGISLNSEIKLRLEESVKNERETAKTEISNHELAEMIVRMAAQLGLDTKSIAPDSNTQSSSQKLSSRLKNIEASSFKHRLTKMEQDTEEYKKLLHQIVDELISEKKDAK